MDIASQSINFNHKQILNNDHEKTHLNLHAIFSRLRRR